MTIPEQLWAIARNTFLESVRQPVVLVVLAAGTLLIILSIPFSGFTMMDDQRMFVDIALSTVFVSGTVLAAFLATSALSREIDSRSLPSSGIPRGPFYGPVRTSRPGPGPTGNCASSSSTARVDAVSGSSWVPMASPWAGNGISTATIARLRPRASAGRCRCGSNPMPSPAR